MRLLNGVDELPAGLRFVLAVGVFDGVHRGHLAMLGATVAGARRLSATAVVLTFEPHPDAVLRGVAPLLLCDPAERIARLADAGIELAVIQRFDRAFADQPAEDFLRRLARGRHMAGLVMTAETAFGRSRGGTLTLAEALGPELGFEVIRPPEVEVGGRRISSTQLRQLVEAGRLSQAKRLLGRDYAVVGTVVRGDGRGRDLGFPTANLAFAQPTALPLDGVYAVRVAWGGPDPLHPARHAGGVASLGVRPTFGGGDRLLEVYVLDFDGDLYGQNLRVEFVRRQRGEKRFASIAALTDQMQRDAERARSLLA